MDDKLLNALSNIGDGLDELVKALKDKKGAKTDTATAIQGGDFGKQLKELTRTVKSIKKDTQEILRQQKTILAQSKQKQDEKIQPFESDPKKESMIKKGVGVILLIAIGVLAIGMAFKLIGKVDFLSVIALSLAIVVIAHAFEKIATMKIDLKDALKVSAAMVFISIGIALSSFFLSKIQSISIVQGITAVLIAGAFMLVAPSIAKMMNSLKELSLTQLIVTSIALPLILPAIALGIYLASIPLSLVKPIGLGAFIGSVMVGAIFTVLAFGLKKIIQSFKEIDPATIAVSAITIPILFTAVSYAIMYSSEALSKVVPIGFPQFLTAIGVSIVFVIISFAVSRIINASKDLKMGDLIKLPILFTLISAAIVASAFIFSKGKEYLDSLDFMTMLKIVVFSLTVGIAIVVMAGVIWVVNKLGDVKHYIKGGLSVVIIAATIFAASKILTEGEYEKYPGLGWTIISGLTIVIFSAVIWVVNKLGGITDYIKGGLCALIVAGVVMVTSHILALGDYSNAPDLSWVIATGLAIVGFGLSMLALGAVALTGVGLVAFLAGVPMVLAVAATIVGTSLILANGKYDVKGMLPWAMATSLLYSVFVPAIIALGALGIAGGVMAFFGAEDPFEKAKRMMIQIAETIVEVSFVLQRGKYVKGPTKEWAEGVGIAIGAFAPVYSMLMNAGIMKILGGGDVSPEAFASAINTVSTGIVDAAKFFKENKSSFENPPPVEWAEGVGGAIGAFAPVYEVLMKQKGIFGSGVSVKDMAMAINTISDGIIIAAAKFAKFKGVFRLENIPPKEWGEGVGAALAAFAPVFTALGKDKGFFESGGEAINKIKYGILAVSDAIILTAAKFFTGSKFFNTRINPNFIADLTKNVIGFVRLSSYLQAVSKTKGGLNVSSLLGNDPISQTARGMTTMARGFDTLAKSLQRFGSSLNSLNVEKIAIINRLTGNMAILAAMDSLMFDNMMATLEKRASVFAQLASANIEKTEGISQVKTFSGASPGEKTGKYGTMTNQLDLVIDLLTTLNASTSQLDEFLASQGFSEPPKAPPEL